MPAGKRSQGEEEKKKKGPSLLEWVAALVGALIAVGMLVFIGIGALQSSAGAPPRLQVRPTSIVAGHGMHIVGVEVANRSAQTAAAVQIQGELRQGGQTLETSTATLSYVPGHSERQAGLIFSRDPRSYQVEVRATGYERP
jgi:uncharacterized protein (TIGR02588 family)